jgi:hypothetical protein
VGNIPHSREENIKKYCYMPMVARLFDVMSPRLGLWGLVLALARACVFVVGLVLTLGVECVEIGPRPI